MPAHPAWAQTAPAPQPEPGQQPGQAEETQPPAQPAPTEPPVPLQQFPLQQPGRPPVTPGLPPATTLPPWTPPVLPPPSQTNVPAPFPLGGGSAPFVGGGPGGGPSAFAPTITTLRGATLEFHPTLHASEEYSDNFFQTTTQSEDNFRSTLGPGFTLLMNGARTFGTLATTVDLVHDTAPNSGDTIKVFPSLFTAIRYAFTPRLSLTVTDTFVRNDSASALDRSGIRRGRQISDTNTLGLTADWLIDRIATQAYYRNVLFFNEDDDQADANTVTSNRGDSVSHILGANASTRLLVDYIVRGGYEFSRTDETGGAADFDRDTITHTVFSSAARQFGLYTSAGLLGSYSYQTLDSTRIWNASVFGSYGIPQGGLSLAGSVGYSMLTSDTEDSEGTVSAALSATYRFTRAAISVGVSQDFRQTGQQGQNFGTVEGRSYFGSFLYQLTPFINTTLHARYSENEPTGTGNIDRAGTQTTLEYGAALNWQLLRWLTTSLAYLHTKQTGNDVFNQTVGGGSGDFAENRVTLSLFATF
ncbi:MAG: hypothetical protein ACREK9_19005 [Candidatus Rokuibacteriota bacterium]